MCCERPYLWILPIGGFNAGTFGFLYLLFNNVLGPLTLNQEYGYMTIIFSNYLVFAACIGAIYVVTRHEPHSIIGKVTIVLLVLGCALGLYSSLKLLDEPTKPEMQNYLAEHYHLHSSRVYEFGAPLVLLSTQSAKQCCGIGSYEDYNWNRDLTKVSVPESCCRNQRPGCGKNLFLGSPESAQNRIYVKGCIQSGMVDLGVEWFAMYKFADSVPICLVLVDFLVLAAFGYYYWRFKGHKCHLDPTKNPTNTTSSLNEADLLKNHPEIAMRNRCRPAMLVNS